MRFENIRIYNFENALRGMRNPKESWNHSDSAFGIGDKNLCEVDWEVADTWVTNEMKIDCNEDEDYFDKAITELSNWLIYNGIICDKDPYFEYAYIGPADMKLAQTLIKAGSEHRKFLRQIIVSVDITAPLYFFKELDTYKVGTVANSTSTMHKITSKPITFECFETGDYCGTYDADAEWQELLENSEEPIIWMFDDAESMPLEFIEFLEDLRKKYLLTKDKRYWKELIRWLPESWLQTRTVTMNYENLLNMCSTGQRRFHKLTEWSKDFIDFARSLPYAQDFIFLDEVEETIFEKLKKI